MTREPWYESDNPGRVVRGGSWRLGLFVIAVVLFVGAIGVGAWLFSVGTSDIKGQGDAERTKNAAGNRIAAQEGFEQAYADVKAADQRIDVMAIARKADPADVVARTNYTGSITYCIQVRADYDARARKFTQGEFRAADLPYQIDPRDPATDCKETTATETPR